MMINVIVDQLYARTIRGLLSSLIVVEEVFFFIIIHGEVKASTGGKLHKTAST